MKEFMQKFVNRILAAIISPILLYFTYFGVVAIYNLLTPPWDNSLFDYFSILYMFAFFIVSVPLFILVAIPVSILIDRVTTKFRWITYPIASGTFGALLLLFNFIINDRLDMFVFGSIVLYFSAGLSFALSIIFIEKVHLS
ncbi:hypothetical protein ACFQ4N_09615 [Oceanobacillus iheyensis]|uniref:hypothetical protein n=1 Tax=Oceanobacillus iheyensis TaxID=182710 RepID=UPI003628AE57